MTRILFAVSPAPGHVNPSIAVAQRLRDAGHAVAYACHPAMGGTLGRAGLDLLPDFRWGDRMVAVQRAMATRKGRWVALVRGGRGTPTGIYFEDLGRGVDDLVRTIRAWRPDVVVTDLFLHLGAIAAEACAVPYASFVVTALPLPSAALPPYGFGLPRNTRGGWRWWVGRAALLALLHSGDLAINRARRRHGLAGVRGDFFHPSPFLILAFVTEAFEYARPDLPPQVYYVGPSVSARRGDIDVAFPWDWLDGRPAVYASLGTLNTGRTGFYDAAIEASAGQPWQLVVSVGRHLDAARWAGAPDNVLVRPYVPQPALLRRVRAVVGHGGMNTVTEALAAGVPLAAGPAGADQSEVVQRVVEAGAGLRFRLRGVGAATLRAAIRRLLEDPALRAGAARVARDFARCDGPGVAAALILRLARERAPLHRAPGRRPTVYAGELGEIA